jgi:uncharacterized protein (DUF2236 family)
MLTAGELLGVRRDLAPPHIAAFRAYMADAMPRLRVTPEAREIARDLFSGRGVAALGGWGLRQLTLSLLQPELREAYGFEWSRRQERMAALALTGARATLRVTPRPVRTTPWFLRPPSPRR